MPDTTDDDATSAKRAVVDLYNRVAVSYDSVGPAVFARLGERVVAIAGLRAGDRTLDVATGRGANLFPAAAAVGASGRVVGIDLAEEMVAETAQAVHARGLSNVSVEYMDAEELTFADGSFDAVLCSFAYFFFPHLDRALGQFWRVLQPGGALLLTARGEPDARWRWYEELLATTYERHGLPWPPPLLGGGHRSQGELAEALTRAGFRAPRWAPAEAQAIYADEEQWWAAQWTHGARRPLEALPPAILQDFAATVKARMREQRAADGFHEWWRIACAVTSKPDAP